MATKGTSVKRSQGKARSTPKRSTSGALTSEDQTKNIFDTSNKDYKEVLKELITSPAVKYVAGGIAMAVLTKMTNKLSDRYPEISSFLKENLDSLSGKMSEFRDDLQGRTHH